MASDDITRQLRRAEYLRHYFAATGREYATGRNVKCPNAAAHSHGDANPSASIQEYPDGALVKCFRCGKIDIFDLWRLDHGDGSFPDVKQALCDFFGIANTPSGANASRAAHTSGGDIAEIGTAQGAAADRVQATPDKQTADYIAKCAATLLDGEDGEAGRAYLTGRGISVETARRFNVGYDPTRQVVIIPQGAGYMARTIKPDAEQKDKCRYYPKGAPRVLFNGDEIIRLGGFDIPVFIVEGEIDALSIAEVGGVAVSCGGTSGIGKAVKTARIVGGGLYVPCMDRDKAGEDAQGKLVAALRKIGGEVCVYEGAPKILMPDATDGTHPKDANESLQRDKAAFRAAVAEVISKAQAYAKEEEAKHRPYFTLAELQEPPPEEENPRALFRGGYLRKGHGLVFASIAGVGKSTFSLQCALHWVLGAPCFGINPVRPLKIAVIQAEDDEEELAMFRASMKQGMSADGFSPERIDAALERLQIRTDFLGKTGKDFVEALGTMQSKDRYDLVVVNPLNSYFDGDISLNKDATDFFRKLIDPVIKNPATECGILFVHHTGKPLKGKDADKFYKGAYTQYATQGGAEVNNWARAIVMVMPFGDTDTFFTLTAAKRWKPLGWTDADGNPTRNKVIAYSDKIVYWREPSADEIAAAKNGATPSRKQDKDLTFEESVQVIVTYLQTLPTKITKTDLRNWCRVHFNGFNNYLNVDEKTGEKRIPKPCNNAFDHITEWPDKYGVAWEWSTRKSKGEYTKLYGGVAPVTGNTAAQAEPSAAEAAEEFDDFI